jgi:hypothetical protein
MARGLELRQNETSNNKKVLKGGMMQFRKLKERITQV